MAKKVSDSALQDRRGIAIVNQVVTTDLQWLFREQTVSDYGIDAHIEVVDDEKSATGRLLALQVKSGDGYFKNLGEDGWWFRLRNEDLVYWQEHSLPVIIVLCDTENEVAYWQRISDETIVLGKRGGKKILVPRENRLSRSSKFKLSKFSEGKPYEVAIRQLRLALPWMQSLLDGNRLFIEAQEWINKTSGRGTIELHEMRADGEEEVTVWQYFAGSTPYEIFLPRLFPWADLSIDEDLYADADHDRWEEECTWNDRNYGRIFFESFEVWKAGLPEGIRPYRNGAGEVDFWRLELKLNNLGIGFMAVDAFGRQPGVIYQP